MRLAESLRAKQHALRTAYRMWRHLKNWHPAWSAYRGGTRLPPLAFRRGFTLHHGKWDCPISLLHEVFADRLYTRNLTASLEGLVVDIGAFVLDMAARWPRIEIHAYEPNPATCDVLRHNVEQNGLDDRVTVFGEAVTGRCGLFKLWGDMLSVGSNGYAQNAPLPGARQEVVTSIDLNTVIARAQGRVISLLKIDAEGAEAEILEAADETALRSVRQVAVEYHDTICAHSSSRCREALLRYRFDVSADVSQSPPGFGMLYGCRDIRVSG